MFCRWEFCSRKKGGDKVGKTKRGKGTKWLVVVDGAGTPLGAHLDSASPAEVKLITHALDAIGVPDKQPQRLIADRGYDSNTLRNELVERGIEPIIPARSNNKKATHQDGRKLKRYKHRWIIERTFAWLGHFRRLVVRYERLDRIYAAFFHLACAFLTLKRF